LLVDAADTFLDGGEGLDVVQVVGSAGVTLDMAESHIEIAVGGDGAHTFDRDSSNHTIWKICA
ncbi:hypothetical protein, partial [Variovorax sp. JS1663]|uniref:hypothetical protein n=1 Tax=Variovorax sp. JS1663 TaxID=1851577 RepID=UPI001302AD5C